MNYRYKLEKGNIRTKTTCPVCKTPKSFVRYIDTETNEYLNDEVGICDRRINCNHHYKPSDYFKDNTNTTYKYTYKPTPAKPKIVEPVKESVSYIYYDLVINSNKSYEANNLFVFVSKLFDKERALNAFKTYKIGTSTTWNGANIFWQIDSTDKVRTGKIMCYNPYTGKRDKTKNNWVHSKLKIANFNLNQCFFGEHTIKENNKPIAIVESEKSAIVCSIKYPQYNWIASSGLNGINIEKMKPIIDYNRPIFLFPDLNCFELWKTKRNELLKQYPNSVINIDSYFEHNSTNDDKLKGLDIADIIINGIRTEKNYKSFDNYINSLYFENHLLMIDNYPASWDLTSTYVNDNIKTIIKMVENNNHLLELLIKLKLNTK